MAIAGPQTFTIKLLGHDLEIARSSERNDLFWQHAASGDWEDETLDFLAAHVSAQTVVLDIGAWIGPVTLAAAMRAARVISVEPDPVARAQLEDSVARNTDNVTVLAAAVGPEKGSLTLYAKGELGDSETSIVPGIAATQITVDMVAFRDVLSMVPADVPLLIKMDIEGSEYDLVDDLAAAVAARRAAVHLSVHPRMLARSLTRGTLGLTVRLQVLRRTISLYRKLERHGKVRLFGQVASIPYSVQLFSWVMLRKRVKNFTMSVVPPK